MSGDKAMTPFRRWVLAACVLLVVGAPATAADLSKIDRSLVKEPKYKGKPGYCLLVFGADAKARVWLVKDGNTLYLDRNGNGDLTEDGERLAGSGGPLALAITAAAGKKYQISQCNLTKLGGPKDQQEFCHIAIDVGGGLRQYSFAGFADTPRKAPVVHFDGPLTIEVADKNVTLVRGEKPTDLSVYMVTRGHGDRLGSTAIVDYNTIPRNVQPVVEIEFPNKEPNGKPVMARYTLKLRC
jgi:hypothetical protein